MTQRRQLETLARNRPATAGAGTLLVGLPHDDQTVHKKSRDGCELFLHDLLLNNVGKDLTPQLGITFHSIKGKDLCRIAIQPSPRPAFIIRVRL